jgi:DNA-binding MarR family transcriptional regulator
VSTLTTYQLAQRLRTVTAALVRLARQSPGEGLTLSQLAMLAVLDRNGPLRMGALALHEQLDPAVATRIVTSLADEALVRRRHDVDDRRVTVVEITAPGRKALTSSRARRTDTFRQRLEALSVANLKEVEGALATLERLLTS